MNIDFSTQEQIKFLEKLGYRHFKKMEEKRYDYYHNQMEYFKVEVSVVEKNSYTSYLHEAFQKELKNKLLNL